MADQPYWASRVADLGIGTAHDGPTPTPESLSAALTRTPALASETRARAAAVAGTIRTDRGDDGRDAAAQRGRLSKAASGRTNDAGSSSQPNGPGAGLHQLGMLEVTGSLGDVPRRQPDLVLAGDPRRRLPRPVCYSC